MGLERLVEVAPALLVLMIGLVALWVWKGKFGTLKDEAEVNPLVFLVAVINSFQQ
jgi:hypothetical protein